MRFWLFAGPNGSGKSTLYRVIPPYLLANYINADDIEKQLREVIQLTLPFIPESGGSLTEFAANQRAGFGSIAGNDFSLNGSSLS